MNNKSNITFLHSDLLKLSIWLVFLIGIVYFTSPLIKAVFFCLLLLLFFLSNPEKDYFWIIIILVLSDYPAHLFYIEDRGIIQYGPIYLGLIELFSITAFLKVLLRHGYPKFPKLLSKPFTIYLVWLIFLLIYGGLFVGISGGGRTGNRYLFNYGRAFLTFPLFYTIPLMLNNNKKLLNLASLLFPLVILNLIGQLFSVFTHSSFHYLLGGKLSNADDALVIGSNLIRPLFGPFITLFSISFASYFYFSEYRLMNRQKLLLIIVLCILSVTIAALRTWMIAYFLLLFALILIPMLSGHRKSVVWRLLFTLLPIFIIWETSDIIVRQFEAVFSRFSTLELILQGDLTAGGTNVRFTDRPRLVMAKFRESPIIGWGFSSTGFEYWDGHVGHQSTLMEGGIIGYGLILWLWYFFIKKALQLSRLKSLKAYKSANWVLALLLITSIVIHTGTQRYGFLVFAVAPSTAFTTSLFLAVYCRLYYFSQEIGR